jgi:hypothetical protein
MVDFNRTVCDDAAGFEIAQSTFFIFAHFLAKADHIGGKDGG